MTFWIRAAFAAPGVMVAAWSMMALAASPFNGHPFWRDVPLNIAEAAAARDAAEVVRQIGFGEDPNVVRPIRAAILADDELLLTPLEAAVAVRDESIVAVLLRAGVVVDADDWTRLRCVADARIGAELERWRPAGAVLACDGIERSW